MTDREGPAIDSVVSLGKFSGHSHALVVAGPCAGWFGLLHWTGTLPSVLRAPLTLALPDPYAWAHSCSSRQLISRGCWLAGCLVGWVFRWFGCVGLCSPRAASTPCSPPLVCLASAALPRSAVVGSLLGCRSACCCCCPLLPIFPAPLLVQAQELTKDPVRSRESYVPRIHWLCQALKHGYTHVHQARRDHVA